MDVTVIVPTHNSAKHVRDAIDSALSQRNVTLEVIAVDDGSSDRTFEVLQSFGPVIQVVRQSNAGAYVARNTAAAKARGEWLAFLDADDVWSSDKLKKQLALAGPNVGLIYSDCLNVDEAGRVTERTSQAHTLAEGQIFDQLLAINFIPTSSVLVRRRDFERFGGFTTEIRGCADWDLWLRIAAAGLDARAHPDALVTYRWHSGQMSKNFAARQADRLRVIERAIEAARDIDRVVPAALRRKAYGSSWATAAWFSAPSDRWTAAWWCIRAIGWQPFTLSHYKLLLKSLLGRV